MEKEKFIKSIRYYINDNLLHHLELILNGKNPKTNNNYEIVSDRLLKISQLK